MTIVRGFNFQPTDQVSADRLYSLVANSQFTNMNWAAAMVPGLSLVGASEPAIPGIGSLWWEYEKIDGLTASTYSGQWSDYQVFIHSPQGKVALFKFDGLESRRFVCTDMNGSNPGHIGMANNCPFVSGVTLGLRYAWGACGDPFTNGTFNWVGTNWQTGVSSASATGFVRTTLMGLAKLYIGAGLRTTLPYPGYLNMSSTGGHTSVFNCSCASTAIMSMGLSFSDLGPTNGVIGWLFGAPVFRSG